MGGCGGTVEGVVAWMRVCRGYHECVCARVCVCVCVCCSVVGRGVW